MHAPTHPHTHTRTHARQSVCVSGRDHRPQAARRLAPDFVDRGESTRARGSKVGAERERMGIRLGSGPAACVRLPHARRLAPNYAPGSSGWGQLTHGMCALCPGEDRFFFCSPFPFCMSRHVPQLPPPHFPPPIFFDAPVSSCSTLSFFRRPRVHTRLNRGGSCPPPAPDSSCLRPSPHASRRRPLRAPRLSWRCPDCPPRPPPVCV